MGQYYTGAQGYTFIENMAGCILYFDSTKLPYSAGYTIPNNTTITPTIGPTLTFKSSNNGLPGAKYLNDYNALTNSGTGFISSTGSNIGIVSLNRSSYTNMITATFDQPIDLVNCTIIRITALGPYINPDPFRFFPNYTYLPNTIIGYNQYYGTSYPSYNSPLVGYYSGVSIPSFTTATTLGICQDINFNGQGNGSGLHNGACFSAYCARIAQVTSGGTYYGNPSNIQQGNNWILDSMITRDPAYINTYGNNPVPTYYLNGSSTPLFSGTITSPPNNRSYYANGGTWNAACVPQNLYETDGTNLYYSADSGNTWTDITSTITSYGLTGIKLSYLFFAYYATASIATYYTNYTGNYWYLAGKDSGGNFYIYRAHTDYGNGIGPDGNINITWQLVTGPFTSILGNSITTIYNLYSYSFGKDVQNAILLILTDKGVFTVNFNYSTDYSFVNFTNFVSDGTHPTITANNISTYFLSGGNFYWIDPSDSNKLKYINNKATTPSTTYAIFPTTLLTTVNTFYSLNSILLVGGSGSTTSIIYRTDMPNFIASTPFTSAGTNSLMTTVNSICASGNYRYYNSVTQPTTYRFVAVGSGNYSIIYSDDGFTWTGVAGANSYFAIGLSVVWEVNKFVAIGTGGSSSMVYSSDGITWTSTVSPPLITSNSLLFSSLNTIFFLTLSP